DYVTLLYCGFGEVEGEAVFVGYGISEPDRGHDDYAGLDVKGKIVVALRGAPSTGGRWDEERLTGYKSHTARRLGAVGFLAFDGEKPVLGTLQERYFEPDLPAFAVSARVVRDLFVGSGRSLSELRA